jgi:hypothetical protein
MLGVGKLVVRSQSDVKARKEYAWSRGLGIEISPIKTRSARKKSTLVPHDSLFHIHPPKVGPLER